MTSLQVEYWKLEESSRTNRANEGLRKAELQEATRHNKESERIQWAQVGEQSRHNKATETISAFSAVADLYNKYNWKQVQDQQLALQRQDVAIRERQNEIRSLELDLATERLSFDKTRTLREFAIEEARVDIQKQQLALDKWDEGRKWLTTISSEGRAWTGEARQWSELGLRYMLGDKKKKKKDEVA